MLKLCCLACGVANFYDESLVQYAFDSVHVDCYNCGRKINIGYESAAEQPIIANLPALPIGTVVVIINREHPWSGDIGIIRNKKFNSKTFNANTKITMAFFKPMTEL
jgi:hypothetical protein